MFLRSDVAALMNCAKDVLSEVDLSVNAESAGEEDNDKAPAMGEDVAEIYRICFDPTPTSAHRTVVSLEEGNEACTFELSAV